MASLLHNSTRWIESVLVHAASYGGGRGGDPDDDSDAHLMDSQFEPEPQTNDTLPSGLLPTPEKDDNNKKAPPRRGRIAQVIRRGGDLDYYDALAESANSTANADEGGGAPPSPRRTRQKKQKRGPPPPRRSPPCPPYLILHDGRHAALAFLSPETLAACGNDVPPNKCLLTVGQFAVSTVLQCAGSGGLAAHSKILRDVYSDAALIPEAMEETLRRQVHDRLFLCLYLQTGVNVIGAENQGLIGDPVDAHCSVPLRRALMAHQKACGGEAGNTVGAGNTGGELDAATAHLHALLVDRLEAVHCEYQMDEHDRLAELRRGGSPHRGHKYGRRHNRQHVREYDDPPDWPWESRLDDPPEEGGGVPGNVDCSVKREEEGVNLEAALEGEQNVAGAQTGDGANGVSTLARGNVTELLETSFTGDEFAEHNEEETTEDRNNEGQGDDDANENDNTGGGDDAPSNARQIEQGNVQELFDNFEDLDEILDIEPEEDTGAAISCPDRGERNAKEPAGDKRGEGEPPADMDLDATGDDRGASFVGIDDMMVDEDEEDEDGDDDAGEGRKGGGNDDEEPLFTQPDQFYSEDGEDDEEELYPKSQVPVPTKKARPSAMGRGSDSDDDDYAAESQIPMAMRKAPPETLGQREESESESDDERLGPESQIPMPRRKKATNVAKEERRYVESQIPLGGNRVARSPAWRREPDSDESSEDSWMDRQAASQSPRRGSYKRKQQPGVNVESSEESWMGISSKPKQQPGAPTSSVAQSKQAHDDSESDSPSESQMAAGEGSEESVLPRKSQRNQKSQKSRGAKRRLNEDDEEDGDRGQGGQWLARLPKRGAAKTRDDSAARHVRFSIEGDVSGKRNEPASNEGREGNKPGPAKPRRSAPAKKPKKDRKAGKKFSMGWISENASRMVGS